MLVNPKERSDISNKIYPQFLIFPKMEQHLDSVAESADPNPSEDLRDFVTKILQNEDIVLTFKRKRFSVCQ